jgi:AcrR family transcriptional regulator
MARKSISDIRKPEILEHFYQVMTKKGFEGASIAKIAKSMGVHPSLIIHYFNTKEELVMEMVDFITTKFEDNFLSILHAVDDPRERFDVLFNTILGFEWGSLINYRVYLGCLYLSTSNERIRERFQKMFERFREVLVEEFILYQKHGIIDVAQPEKMAGLIIALVDGFDHISELNKDPIYHEGMGIYIKNIVFSVIGERRG